MTSPSSRRIRVGACLSLSGKFARFGRQAAQALQVWQDIDDSVDLVLEDDESRAQRLEVLLPEVSARADLVLGPYSTLLMRTAGDIAADTDLLIWNHGGSGDDVQCAHPGHVVSVLSPTSRYAEPFLRLLAAGSEQARLWITAGRGSFADQVSRGAAQFARTLGIEAVIAAQENELPDDPSGSWDLFSVGQFEHDAALVKRALQSRVPPRILGAVAAGVREFSDVVEHPEGVYGIAQWFPGRDMVPELGPMERDFLRRYAGAAGGIPDYPAVQAVAAAVIAMHCARLAGSTHRDALWQVATTLDTNTLLGNFRIDPATGAQIEHQTTLVQWTPDGLVAVA